MVIQSNYTQLAGIHRNGKHSEVTEHRVHASQKSCPFSCRRNRQTRDRELRPHLQPRTSG